MSLSRQNLKPRAFPDCRLLLARLLFSHLLSNRQSCTWIHEEATEAKPQKPESHANQKRQKPQKLQKPPESPPTSKRARRHHKGRHAGVHLPNLGLEEEEVPNAVGLHAGSHHPARLSSEARKSQGASLRKPVGGALSRGHPVGSAGSAAREGSNSPHNWYLQAADRSSSIFPISRPSSIKAAAGAAISEVPLSTMAAQPPRHTSALSTPFGSP